MSEQSAAGVSRDKFEEEIAAVRIRTGEAADERRYLAVGLGLMIAGVVVCVIAFFASRGLGDTRDVITYGVTGALIGLSLSIAGAALFLRYSMGRFLRFWLLRLIYEAQDARR